MDDLIRQEVSLAPYSTLRVGGSAAYLAEVTSIAELQEVLSFAKQHTNVPPLVIGSGSNVLFREAGYPGVVVVVGMTGITQAEEGDSVLITAAAGELLDTVVLHAVQESLWGLENLSAIPGTIGATPVQNVGAYGVEVSDLIVSVTALHMETGEQRIFSNEDCQFAYRESFFKTESGRKWIITSVTFRLKKDPAPQLEYGTLAELQSIQNITPQQVRDEIESIRAGKFPDWHHVGTAGSFFKNPIISPTAYDELLAQYPDVPGFETEHGIKVSLGYVLDKICGLRGYSNGPVCLYENQALVLVATKGARASLIENFAREITNRVEEKTKIKIEPEVRFV